MYPMDYEEFLWALGDCATAPLLRDLTDRRKSVGEQLNRRLMHDFRLYMLVSGMPQAVNEYIENNNFRKVGMVKRVSYERSEHSAFPHDQALQKALYLAGQQHLLYSLKFERLDPKELSQCLSYWLEVEHAKRAVVAVDGKTICGSANEEHKAYHAVCAFVHENQITLGEIAVPGKTNETTAIPELLDLVDIKGQIITIDAAGYQKKIADKNSR